MPEDSVIVILDVCAKEYYSYHIWIQNNHYKKVISFGPLQLTHSLFNTVASL